MKQFLIKYFSKRSFSKVLSLILTVFLIVPFVQTNISVVNAEISDITTMHLKYDVDVVDLNTAWTEGEVQNRFRNSASIASPDSSHIQLSSANCGLVYDNDPGAGFSPREVGDGTNQVSADKTYYFKYYVNISDLSKYKFCDKWTNCTTLTRVSDISGYPWISYNDMSSMPDFTYVVSINNKNTLLVYIRALNAGKASTDEKVTGVVVNEDGKSIRKGRSRQYYATVKGNASNKTVKWTLAGSYKSGTKIDQFSGLLSVASNETANNITVVATSNFDSNKKYAFGVKVNNKTNTYNVRVGMDYNSLRLNPIYTEGELTSVVRSLATNDTIGCSLDLNNTGIVYSGSDNTQVIVNPDDQNHVNASKKYMARIGLKLNDGYTWPECLDDVEPNAIKNCGNYTSIMSFCVNDTTSYDYLISYDWKQNVFCIYFPIDFVTVDLAKIDNELTVSGLDDQKYTGSPITPEIKIKRGDYELFEGKDYTVSYSNNTEIGKATVTITGILWVYGEITRTFNIVKELPGSSGNSGSSSSGNASGSGNSSGSGSTAPKYKNEWVQGKWYNENGVCDYDGTLTWKCNDTGWWVEDSKGWYPVSQWVKIDGKWYYFLDTGYMDYSEYRDGYWLGSDGALVDGYYGQWKSDSNGWWFEDESGWYPSSQWVWINGKCYYFEADGYLATNKYVDGYWVGADGACQ